MKLKIICHVTDISNVHRLCNNKLLPLRSLVPYIIMDFID